MKRTVLAAALGLPLLGLGWVATAPPRCKPLTSEVRAAINLRERGPSGRLRVGSCDHDPTRSSDVKGKPTPPIDLEARLLGDPAAPFAVVASASSRLDAEIELDVVVPDGVSVVAGESKRKGKRPDLKLDLRTRDRSPREIFVRATMDTGGARTTRVLSLPLGSIPAAPRGALKRNSRGESIREFGP